jgi:hypothetical protein
MKVIGTVLFALLLPISPSSRHGRFKYEVVQGSNLLLHPSEYNGKIILISGTCTQGMERENLTFSCPGSLDVSLSLTKNDLTRFGFLTSRSSIEAMNRNFRHVSTKDILIGEINAAAKVSIVGLYRCHYDFSSCEGATRSSGLPTKETNFNEETQVRACRTGWPSTGGTLS